TSSGPSMRGRPPKADLDFWLSSRASPRVTRRNSSPLTLMQSVLAICPGSTPCTSAASCTVAVEALVTRTVRSGARAARSVWTEARLIEGSSTIQSQRRQTSKQARQPVFILEPRFLADRRGQRPAHEVTRNVGHPVKTHQLGNRNALTLIRRQTHRHAGFHHARLDHPAIGAWPARLVETLEPSRFAHL